MTFRASVTVLAARFACIAVLNWLIPDEAESADSMLLAIWMLLFVGVDAIALCLLMMANGNRLLLVTLYLSMAWAMVLAVEHVSQGSTLWGYDGHVQIGVLVSLCVGLVMELRQCRRSRRRSSSLRF